MEQRRQFANNNEANTHKTHTILHSPRFKTRNSGGNFNFQNSLRTRQSSKKFAKQAGTQISQLAPPPHVFVVLTAKTLTLLYGLYSSSVPEKKVLKFDHFSLKLSICVQKKSDFTPTQNDIQQNRKSNYPRYTSIQRTICFICNSI